MRPQVSTTCFLSWHPLRLVHSNDVALVALSITGSTLAAKRSAFILVEDDAVTLRLPELWGAPWLWRAKVGSTGISAQLDAEEWRDLVQVYGPATAQRAAL